MHFRKVTATKYIGEAGYTLIKSNDDIYCICKNSKPVKWGSYFVSVNAAEAFMNSHDYIHASEESIGIAPDDIVFAMEMYGLELGSIEDQLVRKPFRFSIHDGNKTTDPIYITAIGPGGSTDLYTTNELLCFLDDAFGNDVLANISFRGVELRRIVAANDRKSAREITQNLVRVKSSNVWSWGIEIKDNKAKTGDVYVQFKGKNGGPADVYRYYDVSIQTWKRMLSYPSAGASIWKFLRNNFLYSKLTGSKKGVLPNAVN